MPRILYTVTAAFPDQRLLTSYIEWLTRGHVQDVVRAGAVDARVSEAADPEEPPSVEASYVFPSRETFDRYLADHAPALRAEGLARFGPDTGIRFARRVATLHDLPRAPGGADPASPIGP